MRFGVSLLLVAGVLKLVNSFPSGAGSCGPGNTSVGSDHLINPTTGSLAAGGFTVSLDGAALAEGKTSIFAVGKDVKVTVAGKAFKGFLVRLGKTDVSTIGAFKAQGNDVQVAAVCFDAGGITHTSKRLKRSISATLNLPAAAVDMPVDITVVVNNDDGDSEYYYSQFTVTAGHAPDLPVPVVMQTQAPVRPIVFAKTAAPVLPVTLTTPVIAKTPTPTNKSTPSPTNSPTKPPIVSSKIPTIAPIPPVNVASGSYVWTKPGWWFKYRRKFGTKAYGLKKCNYLENEVPVNGTSCRELATGPYFCAFGSQFTCGRSEDFFDNPTIRCNCYDGKFDCFPVIPDDINCADY
jgi:hypothetical protein